MKYQFRPSLASDFQNLKRFYGLYFEKNPKTLLHKFSDEEVKQTTANGSYFLCLVDNDIVASMKTETDTSKFLKNIDDMKPLVYQNISTSNAEIKNFDKHSIQKMMKRSNTLCCYGGSSVVLDDARNQGLLNRLTIEHAKYFKNHLAIGAGTSTSLQHVYGAFGILPKDPMGHILWKIYLIQTSILLNALFPNEDLEIYVFGNDARIFTFFGNCGKITSRL